MPDPDEGRFQSPLRAVPLPDKYVTRRHALAGVKGALGLGLAVGTAELVPLGGIEGWAPAPDTWPLARYDLSNTAATDATPPTDPSVAWTADVIERHDDTALVVGSERVYVGGDGLAALSRSDGGEVWHHEGFDSGCLALRDGTLYTATASDNFGINGEDAGIGAFDAATGEREWLRPLPRYDGPVAAEAASLLVADGTVLVGHDTALSGHDAASGRRRFVDLGADGATHLSLADGDLYATGARGPIGRYRARDLLDVPLGSGPDLAWRLDVSDASYNSPPAVADRVFVARFDRAGRAALVARHPRDGTVVWRAFTHPDGPGDATGFEHDAVATTLAVADDTLVAGVGYGGDDAPPNRVVALSPVDGTVRWRDSVGRGFVGAGAVAEGTALVVVSHDATDTTPERSEVRAYALDSGEERWRVGIEDSIASVAPVAGTVFAVDHDGRVHALRD